MRTYTKNNPLLMIPGPVEGHYEVLESMNKRVFSHTEPKFVKAFQGALQNLKPIFRASDNYHSVVIAGGGTLAMEIAMLNLIDKDISQKALICQSGYFGKRYATLAQSLGLEYDVLESTVGEKIRTDLLQEKLESTSYDFVFIQHVDTSTGVANDVKSFGKVCSDQGVISVVDGVCALGGQEMYQEKWGIDIYLTGAQKALAIPPGLAILMYSPKAREISENRSQKIPSYYSDLENWWPILDAYSQGTVKYFSTPATNLIYGLFKATDQILMEGMENVFSRHRRLSTKFRNAMQDFGFGFITAEDSRAATMSALTYHPDIGGAKFRSAMMEEGVQVAGGIQAGIAETYFRVGHMGNVGEREINYTLKAVENSIERY